MPFRILVADDDEAVRKSHVFAVDAAAELLKDRLTVVESDDSIDAWAKIAAATDLNRGSQSFNQQLRVTPESASAHSRDGAIHFYKVERREARRS